MQDNQNSDVSDVLMNYFDGLYHSDATRLKDVFHPKAHYVCATDGALQYLTMDEYFPIVEARTSPKQNGEVRRDRIISIKQAGPATAIAHVECSIGVKLFSDFLTLIRLNGKWQIISKVFHYDFLETS